MKKWEAFSFTFSFLKLNNSKGSEVKGFIWFYRISLNTKNYAYVDIAEHYKF